MTATPGDQWRTVRDRVDRALLRVFSAELDEHELVTRPRDGWESRDELEEESDSVFAEVCWW